MKFIVPWTFKGGNCSERINTAHIVSYGAHFKDDGSQYLPNQDTVCIRTVDGRKYIVRGTPKDIDKLIGGKLAYADDDGRAGT